MYFKFVTKNLERLGVVSCQISYKVLAFTFSHTCITFPPFTYLHSKYIFLACQSHIQNAEKMSRNFFFYSCVYQLCSPVSNAFPAMTNPYTTLFLVLSPNQENFIYVSNFWHVLHVQYLLSGYQCLPSDRHSDTCHFQRRISAFIASKLTLLTLVANGIPSHRANI